MISSCRGEAAPPSQGYILGGESEKKKARLVKKRWDPLSVTLPGKRGSEAPPRGSQGNRITNLHENV